MAYGTTTIPNLTDKPSLASTDELVIRDTSAGEDKKFSFGSAPLESGNNLSDLGSVSTALGNLSLATELQNLTSGEIGQLENIGSTTISNGQWSVLGGLAGTLTATELNLMDGLTTAPLESGNDLSDLSSVPTALGNLSLDTALQNLTSGEIGQLENIGSVTITNTQWGFLGGMNAQPIEPADSVEAADGTAGSPGLFFTGDADVGLFRPALGTISWSLAGSEAMRLDGSLFLGTTSNSNMTQGLTLNQDTADDEILACKSSDVAHGVTARAETDVFGAIRKSSAANGGLQIRALSSATRGWHPQGFGGSSDTTKGTSADAFALVDGFQTSGTGIANADANANIFAVRTQDNAGSIAVKFIVDEDGDLHNDGASGTSTFDEYDDVALISGLRGSLMDPQQAAKEKLAEFIEYARPVLEARGVVTYNEDGHHFVSYKGMSALLIDAIRQVGGRAVELEARVAQLEAAQA